MPQTKPQEYVYRQTWSLEMLHLTQVLKKKISHSVQVICEIMSTYTTVPFDKLGTETDTLMACSEDCSFKMHILR